MGRPKRVNAGGLVYHVLNRASPETQVFDRAADFQAFERVLAQAQKQVSVRLLAYCVMPDHWHLVLWPYHDGDLSKYVGWLTLTHTQRWHARRRTTAAGHLYQGRFRSFLVEPDEHLLAVCRYVERNPLRSGLVDRAEAWQWSSAGRRWHGGTEAQAFLGDWPVPRPRSWPELLDQPQPEAELDAIRRCVIRGSPFGSADWVRQMVERYDLHTTLRPRGRPRKKRDL